MKAAIQSDQLGILRQLVDTAQNVVLAIEERSVGHGSVGHDGSFGFRRNLADIRVGVLNGYHRISLGKRGQWATGVRGDRF